MDSNTGPQDAVKARYWAEKKARQNKPDRFGFDTLARAMWTGLFKIAENGRYRPDHRTDKTEQRHLDFIAAYNANPLNFLSGSIVHKLQRTHKSQVAMEANGQEILDELRRRRAA